MASYAGLTRVHLHEKRFRRSWTAGSSPVMTACLDNEGILQVAVARATRSVPTNLFPRKMVGTAQERLCPPYEARAPERR